MLERLIAFSLRQSAFVLLIAVALVAYTVARLSRMPVDVFPELNAPTVVILTESGGLAADEVEQYVSFPLESAVNGLPGVRRVRSASAISLSLVWVEFDWGTDIYLARQLVSERLGSVRESLPANAHAEITPISSITGEIMLLALSSPDKTVSDLDLRAYAEFDLRNKLLAVPGIAQVSAIGGELPEYQINVKQDRLALYGLTIQDVTDAARKAHSTASAGYLADVDRQELPIRQAARVQNVDDIRGTIVTFQNGSPITLGEVADIKLGAAPKRGTAAAQGMSSVVLTIQKSPGTNTITLTRAVDETLDGLQKAVPAGIVINRDVFRQTNFINRSISNVVHVLRDATIIVGFVLILFLLNVRTTIITLTALPLSLAVALLTLDFFGLTLNVMTLGGLAVAIGELVDDAIIDVENVFRRLQENGALPLDQRHGFVQVIFDASNEIRSSVVFATILICVVFLPLMFLEGLEGRFFKPLALTYIISIMASLVVALTVTPALCKLLLRPRKDAARTARSHEHTEGFLVRWLKRGYEPALRWAIGHRALVLSSAAVVTCLSLLLARTFGTSFLPEFNEGSLTVFLSTPPGTSLAESDRVTAAAEQNLIKIDGILSVTRRTGRAERDEHAEPVSNSELEVTLRPEADMRAVRAAVSQVIQAVPGLSVQIGQPIEHRLSHILSGTPAAIAINVYGEDLSVLRQIAKEIEAELDQLPGARDVTANREIMITSLPIRYRHQDLAAAGLTPVDAAEQVQTALYGETVAEVNQGVRRFDIVVRLDESERQRVEQLRDLLLRGQGGAIVRLSQVADIGPERTSNIVARENAQRKATISCNVADGYNLGDLVTQVKARVEPIVARAGYTVAFGGQFEAQQSASKTILLGGAAVALVMVMLLQLSTGSLKARVEPIVARAGYTVAFGGQFEAQQSASRTILLGGAAVALVMVMLLQLSTGSLKVALLVMINLPLALIGGVAAIFLTESPSIIGNAIALFGIGSRAYVPPVISIASMVGFITLFGIAVRNGILLVNHYRHLQEREGVTYEDSIVRGSMERLVPILMTAISAMLGLLPLAIALGEPGSELLAPLAVVVLGGLISSTLLNLFIVPAGYSLLHARGTRREEPDTEKDLIVLTPAG